MRFVRVHATAVERKGRLSNIKCKRRTPSPYESQSPLPLSQEEFGLTSPCPPTIISVIRKFLKARGNKTVAQLFYKTF